MSSPSPTPESTSVESTESRLDAVAELFSRSISLKVAAAGVVLYALAFAIDVLLAIPYRVEAQSSQFDLWGLWAAIMGIWGATLFLIGTVTFAVIWWKRQ